MTSSTSILGHLTQFRARLRTGGLSHKAPAEELPLRSELFSAEQMERHGKTLAAAHRLTPRRVRDRLLPRLAANETVLVERLQAVDRRGIGERPDHPGRRVAARQLPSDRRTDRHGQEAFAARLQPGVATFGARVRRRVCHACTTSRSRPSRTETAGSTPTACGRFVSAYQSVTTLNLGELWAIPIMLRLALIENLRRVAVRIAAGRIERDLANTWADRMMETAERDPESLILVIADMARSTPPMASAFVAELARRLQGQSAALALALTWIEQRLAESHLTIEQLVQTENQQQASDQVSISNSIGSLRFLSAIDWRDFVETISVVENILRQDPQGVYGAMEFATRDRYRHATERIARKGRLSEVEVAAEGDRAGSSERCRQRERRSGGACRLLSDRQGPSRAGTRRRSQEFHGVAPGEKSATRFPLPFYLGAIAVITGVAHRRPRRECACRRSRAGKCWRWSSCFRLLATQPIGGDDRELAGHVAGDAAPIAANGFLRRHRRGGADARRSFRPCSPALATSRIWSRRSKSGSSPIATRTCTLAC